MRALARRVAGRAGEDLLLDCVPYSEIPGEPGIVTAEPAADQGLGLAAPNLPDIGGGHVEYLRARLRVTAPGPDVIRLRFCPDGVEMPTEDGKQLGILVKHRLAEPAGEALVFAFDERPFAFRFGDRLRSGGHRRTVHGLPLAPAFGFGDGRTLITFEIAPGTAVYGLGEDFGSLLKNGRRFEVYNRDALGSGLGHAYKWIPVIHVGETTLFIHTSGPLTVDVGATDASLLQIEVEDPALDLFVIGGGDLRHRLRRYTELTGRPPVLPTWAFGLWMSRCRYRTREELMASARGMRARAIPCDVLNIDPDWLELDRLNCDFRWSHEKYPDPEGMLRELAEMGYHVCLWELPYIDSASPVYEEARQLGHLVRRSDGRPAAADVIGRDARPRGIVDFSSPAARKWWQDKHRPLFEMGVAVMKTDFGEGLPEDAVMADGRSGRAWRNLYPLWYNAAAWEIAPHHFVWGRSGWAGSQRYPAQWGGDPEASVAGMAATLRGGLSYALSAPGLWSHDIGGFYGPGPSPELYVRWAQFGCLSPLARAHGLTPREPWYFGERALSIFREFAELRYRLIPYLVRSAREASETGMPVLRPVALEFPSDPGCRGVELQYMLGPDLLVCPVFSESPEPVGVDLYLPRDTSWVDWWSGESLTGGRWLHVEVPLERLPLYRRAGAEIPLGSVVQHTGLL